MANSYARLRRSSHRQMGYIPPGGAPRPITRRELVNAARWMGNTTSIRECGTRPAFGAFGANDIELWGGVSLLDSGGERIRVVGVQHCNSPWACPRCAEQISKARCRILEAIVDGHVVGRGSVTLATFTIRHAHGQRLRELAASVAKAYRFLLAGRAWKDFQRDYAITGHVRSLEVTHGPNGWHPHIHSLFLSSRRWTDDELAAALEKLYARWTSCVERAGMVALPSRERGVDIRRMEGPTRGNYIAKMGLAVELTRSQVKQGRGEGYRTPWQILADAARGDALAMKLWVEYCEGMKGRKALTWSRGLRDTYSQQIKEAEMRDDERPLQNERLIARISRADWNQYVVPDPDFYDEIIKAALSEGADGVARLIQERKDREAGLKPLPF